jgi:hypothetical protein
VKKKYDEEGSCVPASEQEMAKTHKKEHWWNEPQETGEHPHVKVRESGTNVDRS